MRLTWLVLAVVLLLSGIYLLVLRASEWLAYLVAGVGAGSSRSAGPIRATTSSRRSRPSCGRKTTTERVRLRVCLVQ